jgi:parallel beta-helix repeat protein
VAIRVDGGTDVTIRNANVRGYRFAVLARGTRNLRLIDNELSYGWKPRLYSLVGHESLVDWLSFHDNEDRQWMRFGAAIYLEDVTGGEVAGNRAVQGMNGLLMTRSDGITVRDNELAFNSGLGIGLYRSNRNTIVGNRLDYNVRGYSHGFYQRGQDSAAILVYEQSRNNVIAYNSATHSGDGLFLWAGQSTMNTGAGGANDNLILANDFSFAPTNGIEVTFSRNTIVGNRVEGSRYGVWGGYSWETVITGNCFAGNEVGVAIEHGQDNIIDRNVFAGDATAIELWANPVEPSDWGYPRHSSTSAPPPSRRGERGGRRASPCRSRSSASSRRPSGASGSSPGPIPPPIRSRARRPAPPTTRGPSPGSSRATRS